MMKKPVWILNPELIEKYEAGVPTEVLSKEFNRSGQSIGQIMRKHGLAKSIRQRRGPKPQKRTRQRLDLIRKRLADDATYREIAEELDISPQAVQQLVLYHRLDIQP